MAETYGAGRKLKVKWNATLLAGVREKSVKMNGEPINITVGEDDGWQHLLADAGENSVSISVSGLHKDHVLKGDFIAGTRTRAIEVSWPDGTTVTGSFFLQSYSESGPYKDATTFEAEFVSAGTVTLTVAP